MSGKLLFAVWLATATGCATVPAQQTPGAEEAPAERASLIDDFLVYLEDRGWDLMDLFSARLTVGPGLRVSARATEVLQAGIGSTGPDATGAAAQTAFPAYQVGWIRRQGGVWRVRIAEAGVSLLYYFGEADGIGIMGNKVKFGEKDRGFFDVGFAVHAALAGVEAETRLDEIADFLLGWFGFDIMHDDH
ncbi:MAG: hypothetical protein U1E76_23865 [Planctomycetota bacterium]